MNLATRSLAVIALSAAAVPALAATTTYTSSASFLANVAPGAYTETFTTTTSATAAGPFTSGGFSFTLFAPTGLYKGTALGGFVGTNLPNEPLTVTFTSGNVTAVGGNFFNTNVSDAFQATAVTLTLSDGTTASFTPTGAATNSYRGFTSDVFITSLTLSAPGASLYTGLDNLTVGIAAPVPEPASWLLMAMGACGLMLARRRVS